MLLLHHGRKEGKKEGRKAGRQEGRKAGRQEGRKDEFISRVLRMHSRTTRPGHG